jgi:hypothetical protein
MIPGPANLTDAIAMPAFTTVFLALCAAGFILIGVNTFIDPLAAMAPVGLNVNRIDALNELRATYGACRSALVCS